MLDNYEPISESAKRWNISPVTAKQYCQKERVPGAQKIANRWFVPKDAWPTPEKYGRPPKWEAALDVSPAEAALDVGPAREKALEVPGEGPPDLEGS